FFLISIDMRCYIILFVFFFSSRRRHTRSKRDWSSDVCSSDLLVGIAYAIPTNPLIIATGTAFVSIRSLHFIAKDGRVWSACFSSVICTKKEKTTLITISTLSTTKNAVNEINCNKDKPINGPATTAKFIANAK